MAKRSHGRSDSFLKQAMSKTQLKKELVNLSQEQLIELITDLYEARKEAKDYLDFYVNPDINKRLDKARTAIVKEAVRKSRGYSRLRMTRIRGYIKDIASLNPGAEPVLEIMTYALECICAIGSKDWIKDATQRGSAKLLRDTVAYADRNGMLGDYLPRIEKAVNDMKSPLLRSNEFKKLLRESLSEAIAELGA